MCFLIDETLEKNGLHIVLSLLVVTIDACPVVLRHF